LAFAVASPVFANESGNAPLAGLSDQTVESASDVAPDLSAIEDLEHRMDQELTADVNRILDSIVENRTDQQVRWLADHYFDSAIVGGRVEPDTSPVALTSPANQR
jgi:hypothetical protein